ncbi:pectate lyase family protein [Solibaculum mannosilyticum]|uniref:hypothetical protein n=1 Tax=Solibaculum mannosilyticum TaxID=2780922 RepID=UPI0034B727E7
MAYNSAYTGAQIDEAVRKALAGGTGGGGSGVRTCRLVIGTSAAGWTQSDCDVLCTGQGDDDAINNAIQQVGSMGGGEIVLLSGTYIASTPIMVQFPNISLRGNGSSTVIQRGYSGTNAFLDVLGDNSAISHIVFDSNRSSYPISRMSTDIKLQGSNCSIRYCSVINTGCTSLLSTGNYNVIAYNSFGGNTGIIVSGDSTKIIANDCIDCGEYGITASDNSIVYGNNCSQSFTGLYLDGNNVLTYGNQCVDCSTGIEIGDLNNSIISHNVCNKATSAGIRAESGISIMMANNQCIDFGILIAGGMRITVQNNTCFRDAGYTDSQMTIGILGGEQHVVEGNYILGKDVTNMGGGNSVIRDNIYDFGAHAGGVIS